MPANNLLESLSSALSALRPGRRACNSRLTPARLSQATPFTDRSLQSPIAAAAAAAAAAVASTCVANELVSFDARPANDTRERSQPAWRRQAPARLVCL